MNGRKVRKERMRGRGRAKDRRMIHMIKWKEQKRGAGELTVSWMVFLVTCLLNHATHKSNVGGCERLQKGERSRRADKDNSIAVIMIEETNRRGHPVIRE
jgi:hypothetical protein